MKSIFSKDQPKEEEKPPVATPAPAPAKSQDKFNLGDIVQSASRQGDWYLIGRAPAQAQWFATLSPLRAESMVVVLDEQDMRLAPLKSEFYVTWAAAEDAYGFPQIAVTEGSREQPQLKAYIGKRTRVKIEECT